MNNNPQENNEREKNIFMAGIFAGILGGLVAQGIFELIINNNQNISAGSTIKIIILMSISFITLVLIGVYLSYGRKK